MALGSSFHITLLLYHLQGNLKFAKKIISYQNATLNPYYIVHYIDAMYDSISSFEHLVIKSY